MGVVYFVLRAPGRAPRYRATLEALTEHHRAARECITMGRLTDKYKRANDAIAGFEIAAERDIDAVIARTQELHKKREQVALQKHTQIDQHFTDLHEYAADLDEELRGNGAPPDGSEDGEKPGPAGTEPGKLASNAWDSGNAYLARGDDIKTG
jgi:hypothetical protein